MLHYLTFCVKGVWTFLFFSLSATPLDERNYEKVHKNLIWQFLLFFSGLKIYKHILH